MICLDRSGGGDTRPPVWVTAKLPTDAIRVAAAKVRVDGPIVDGRTHTFTFGRQLSAYPDVLRVTGVGLPVRELVCLGAYGPMRPEELVGLRRCDVDLDNLVIRVRAAEPERTNGKRAPGDTESDAVSGPSSFRPSSTRR